MKVEGLFEKRGKKQKKRVGKEIQGQKKGYITPKLVSQGSLMDPKKGETCINLTQSQNAGTDEFSVQKNVSAADFDVQGVIQKQKMHNCMTCVTCNSYITKRIHPNLRSISSKPEVLDFDVKRVENDEESHDMQCLSCNSYITKRVIFHKREITPDVEAIRLVTGQMIVPVPEDIERYIPDLSTPEVSRLDFIKPIVYGGLLQSITSLSVVISASGADASTLNTVTLALANVFGGFLILAHNLRALRQEQNTEYYEQQLGRRGHFLLHATLAIISYFIFGLMSPIIYGFSFYKSDNKYLKLATLAAVSLVCITLLSMGKAYIQRPPKAYIRTMFSYISLGVMVAGSGYVAGELANMLLKKLQVFDSLSFESMPMIEEVVKGAWSSNS